MSNIKIYNKGHYYLGAYGIALPLHLLLVKRGSAYLDIQPDNISDFFGSLNEFDGPGYDRLANVFDPVLGTYDFQDPIYSGSRFHWFLPSEINFGPMAPAPDKQPIVGGLFYSGLAIALSDASNKPWYSVELPVPQQPNSTEDFIFTVNFEDFIII